MRNLTSSIFIFCLCTSMQLQILAAKRIFKPLNEKSIDSYYAINSEEVNTSGKWYDVRTGMSRVLKTSGQQTRKSSQIQKGVMMKTAKLGEKLVEKEIKVFQDIHKKSEEENLLPFGIPSMLDFGKYKEEDAIIQDLLGHNFMTIMSGGCENSPQYYETVCIWAKQVIEALKFLHQQGYAHRDVQPGNIAVGVEDFSPNRTYVSFKGSAYLCNLGLAHAYKHDNGTFKHRMKSNDLGNITPYTSRYAETNCLHFPRNDMESLGYTMLRIAGSKELPWFHFSKYERLNAKETFIRSDSEVDTICEQMGITDVGMRNVFRNYFQLLRFKYFDSIESFKRGIDYEDLSDCFAYPARLDVYFGPLNQVAIDEIFRICEHSANVTISGKYNVARLANQVPNTRKGVMVKMAIEDKALIRTAIKVFKDLYSTSRKENLLPFNIPNMLGYGVARGTRAIILDLLGVDFIELTEHNANNSPQYYGVVCFWASQMITALKFLHQQGYVHRDVQPKYIALGAENFNLNRTDVTFAGSAYLFNLGVSERYKYDNGTIKKRTQHPGLPNETSPYSSRATLGGYIQYPRDDMEELGYTMLTITAGTLPWTYLSIDDIGQKNALLHSSQMVEAVCKTMGMSDMGMINIFKRYFALLNARYFADDDYSREINYEELSACFVYPAY